MIVMKVNWTIAPFGFPVVPEVYEKVIMAKSKSFKLLK